ncbi:DUF3168 domain-containing protein [Salipiger sp.]|uniref:DUF3168 domain-containing protein n=1 Tax=Salipiger sp. TaxID=2078585 RepID=UPI003A97AD55
MSYAMSAALQQAVYERLTTDPVLTGLVGDAVFDAPPAGPLPELFLTLGAERVRDASDGSGHGAWHDLVVAVVTGTAGFRSAKDVAAAASDALNGADLTLSRGRLVSLRFIKAEARRERRGLRRVEMIFRARVEDD